MYPISIPQASIVRLYTPSTDVLPYSYCTFFLESDSTVSFVSKYGDIITLMSLKAGYHPILVQKITAVTTGRVFILAHEDIK